jgi:hypothetical protein
MVAQHDPEAALLVHILQVLQLIAWTDMMSVTFRDDEFTDKRALDVQAISFGESIEGEYY